MGIHTANTSPVQFLLDRLRALGVSYGREDSFKLTHQQLIPDRVLIGIDIAHLPAGTMFDIAHELGMPVVCQNMLGPPAPGQSGALWYRGSHHGQHLQVVS